MNRPIDADAQAEIDCGLGHSIADRTESAQVNLNDDFEQLAAPKHVELQIQGWKSGHLARTAIKKWCWILNVKSCPATVRKQHWTSR